MSAINHQDEFGDGIGLEGAGTHVLYFWVLLSSGSMSPGPSISCVARFNLGSAVGYGTQPFALRLAPCDCLSPC